MILCRSHQVYYNILFLKPYTKIKIKCCTYRKKSRLVVIKDIYVRKRQTVSFGRGLYDLIIQHDVILFGEA